MKTPQSLGIALGFIGAQVLGGLAMRLAVRAKTQKGVDLTEAYLIPIILGGLGFAVTKTMPRFWTIGTGMSANAFVQVAYKTTGAFIPSSRTLGSYWHVTGAPDLEADAYQWPQY